MSQYQNLLNALIKTKLTAINSAISSTIRLEGLDPMMIDSSGSETFGEINLGVCTAKVASNFVLQNLKGLSSLLVNSLTITSVTKNEDGSKLHGKVELDAVLKSNLFLNINGRVEASCGSLNPSEGISGIVTISPLPVKVTGNFDAAIGAELCLNAVDIDIPSVRFGNIAVDIGGLGIFNSLINPLQNLIKNDVNEQVSHKIGSALTPAINNALRGIFPQCTSLT